MAKDVICSVENCQYWDNQNCNAAAIEVEVDDSGANAARNRDTNCHTFMSKARRNCGRARE